MARDVRWARIREQDLAAMTDQLRDAFRAFEDIANDPKSSPDTQHIALERMRALQGWR